MPKYAEMDIRRIAEMVLLKGVAVEYVGLDADGKVDFAVTREARKR